MTSHASIVWNRIARSRRALVGAVMLAMIALVGVFAEVLAASAPIAAFGPRGAEILPAVTQPDAYVGLSRDEIAARHADDVALWPLVRYGPTDVSVAGPLAPASSAHPLGTDAEGRDLAARIIYGARNALGLSFAAVLLGALLGVALGGIAGHSRSWNDILVRLVETVDTFPAIIVVALVRAIEREPSALSLVVAVALVRWAEVARLVRATVLRANVEDYVVAARALGCSPARIFWRHILPNAVGPVVVSSVYGVASVVLLEAAISFLEMGSPSTIVSWGETLAEGARTPGHLRLVIAPAAALLATLAGAYVLADALRDAMDPRAVRTRAPSGPDAPPLSPPRLSRR